MIKNYIPTKMFLIINLLFVSLLSQAQARNLILAFPDINNIFSIVNSKEDFEPKTDTLISEETKGLLIDDLTKFSISQQPGIYPIPAKDVVNIVIPRVNEFTVVQIIDLAGKVVRNEGSIYSKVVQLNISNLSSGYYMVKLFNENQKTTMYKLVKA